MKYYKLLRNMMTWEKGMVFREDEIPQILLWKINISSEYNSYNCLGISHEEPYGSFVCINDDFWGEISEEEWKKYNVVETLGKHVVRMSSNEKPEEDHIPYVGKKIEDIDMEEIERKYNMIQIGDIYHEVCTNGLEHEVKAFLILKELTQRLNGGWEPDWKSKYQLLYFVGYNAEFKRITTDYEMVSDSYGYDDNPMFSSIFYYKDQQTASRALELGRKYFETFYGIAP